jgi:hypothetical protein
MKGSVTIKQAQFLEMCIINKIHYQKWDVTCE